jgi:hypothetical protein
MKKLDFVVVGCMKAGTTTIIDYLNSHSEIDCLENEIQYFSNPHLYSKGEDWYQSKVSVNGEHKIVGEKSTAYSYIENCASKIYKYKPDIKIIWVLRNPISRAYSNYWHSVMMGNENRSFSECIHDCLNNNNVDVYNNYIKRSCYAEQIESYLKYFDIEQMHILFIEDFWENSDAELNRLSHYLNLNSQFPKRTLYLKSNPGYKPWSINLEFYSKKIFGNSFIWRGVHYLNKILGSKYPKIDQEDSKLLNLYYCKPNEKLFKLIERKDRPW